MEREKLEPKLKELGLLGKRSCFGDKLISPQLLDEFYAKVINTSHRTASHLKRTALTFALWATCQLDELNAAYLNNGRKSKAGAANQV